MTPDRRLDQLEPLMADSLQKIDRLIEGQGKILELAINTKNDLDEFKKEVREDLNGVKTDLNEFKKEVREDLNGVKTDLSGVKTDLNGFKIEVKADFDGVKSDLAEVKGELGRVKKTVELTAAGLAELTVSNQRQFDEIKIGQQELRDSQEAIMQYLRNKLT